MRQLLRTHRPFTADVVDLEGRPLLSFHRSFYLINSTISAVDSTSAETIGINSSGQKEMTQIHAMNMQGKLYTVNRKNLEFYNIKKDERNERKHFTVAYSSLFNVGEVHQRWHLWRRKYDLFTRYDELYFVFRNEIEEMNPSQRIPLIESQRYAVWDSGRRIASSGIPYQGCRRHRNRSCGQRFHRLGS